MTTNALTSRAVVKLQMTAIIAAIGVKNQPVQLTAAADIPNAAPKPEIPNQTSFRVKKMESIRSYYDGDRIDKLNVPTTYPTDQNQNEMYCSMCGETSYVNDLIFDDVTRVIEETLENSFLCQECVELYDDADFKK